MTPNINLIGNRNKISARQQKFSNILNIVSFGLLGITLVLSIAIFYYKYSLTTQANTARSVGNTALSTINFLHPRLAKLLILGNRVKNIEEIITSRSQFDISIRRLLAQTPTEVRYSNFTINNKHLTLNIESQSLGPINVFFNNLLGLVAQKKYIKDVTLVSLTNNSADNTYTAALQIDML